MNRAPSPRDPWWAEHQRTCGGTYTKIKEPEGYKEKGGTKDKGHILGGGNSQDNTSRSKHRNKGKIKGHAPNDTSMKIDEMFPKSENRQKELVWIESEDSGSQATPSPNGRESVRNKMLAAAERRLTESNNKGKRVTTQIPGKRPLSHGSRDVREYGGNVAKKSRMESNTAGASSPVVNLSHTTSRGVQESLPPTVIDLCEDSSEQPRPSVKSVSDCSQTSLLRDQESKASSKDRICIDDYYHHSSTKEHGSANPITVDQHSESVGKNEIRGKHSGVVVIDDIEGVTDSRDVKERERTAETPVVVDDEDGFKTCPVCGLNGIPAVIINAHVAFCLDEEDWDE